MVAERKVVLHCIPSMGGGGAERQLAYLCKGLTKTGWDVHVALLEGGPNLASLSSSNSQIHFLRASNNYDPLIIRELCQLIAALKPDIIQTWLPMMNIAGGVASSLMKKPWILSERSSPGAHPTSLRGLIRMIISRQATAIIANSITGFHYWRARKQHRTLLYVIPNAIPVSDIAAAPSLSFSESGIPPNSKVILYAGRLERGKNIQHLVYALQLVFGKADGIALFCGEGPLKSNIIRLSKKLNIHDRIKLMGYTPNIWSWMKSADVFVSVSHFEGCPNTVLESMAAGCPIVISDINSHRELVDEQSAVLVKADSPEEISSAIIETLINRDIALKRARTARKLADHRSVNEMALRYESVYLDILDNYPS